LSKSWSEVAAYPIGKYNLTAAYRPWEKSSVMDLRFSLATGLLSHPFAPTLSRRVLPIAGNRRDRATRSAVGKECPASSGDAAASRIVEKRQLVFTDRA